MADDGKRGGATKWIITGVVVPIVVAVIAAGWHPWTGGETPRRPTPAGDVLASFQSQSAEITLSRASAPIGSSLTVYGSGFASGELVEIRIHTTSVGYATADSSGKFVQTVTVPQSAPPPGFPTNVSATGHSSIRSATAPFSTS